MEKTRISLDILLPDVPDERDECVKRIIKSIENKRGIEKVHVVPANGKTKAQLCFHYDPSVIYVNEVEQLAKKAGAAISEQYGHLLIEVSGIRHPGHASRIETELKKQAGIITVSVSGTGFIELEFSKTATSEEAIIRYIKKSRLNIVSVDNFHEPELHAAKKTATASASHAHDETAGEQDHAHGIFGERTELYFAIICGAFLALGFGLSFVHALPAYVSVALYIGAYLFGGFYTTKEAITGISKGEFEIDFLMLVAAIGAAILGEWAEGALLLFLFSLGHSLEHYAMAKARKSIAALAALAPKTALVKQGTHITEVDIEQLNAGDIVVIKPNSKIAADGIVIIGTSSVNQAPITGESVPVDKIPVNQPDISTEAAEKLHAKHKVFAGSINGNGHLEIKVTRIAADSTIARLVKLVNEAQTQKSPTQNFTDKIEKYYVPAVLGLVLLLLFAFLVIDEPFSLSFYRAMSVLVAASPCALAISTPSAVLSGVARAARGGVLVKGGKPLEELGALNTIAFDKTGTLTEGKPRLTGVYPLNNIPEEKLLEVLVAVEKLSEHPLAAAIVKDGVERLGRDVAVASNVQSIQGRGIKASYNGSIIHIGNKELFTEKNHLPPAEITAKIKSLELQGNTTMLVQMDDTFIGIVTLMDIARPDAKDTLQRLKKEGIRKMIMLTGDDQKVAESIAKEIGITEVWGNLLPEQKLDAIEKLTASTKKVAMVGDGVNDAPAMAKSTVGIAMGAAGNDVALETADIALMADKLGNLPFAIGLSKKAHSIIRQNIIISMGMVFLLVPLTISGIAQMGPAVIGHEGSTVVVVFNALRLLAYKNK